MRGIFTKPAGLVYQADFITEAEHQALLSWIRGLELRQVVMHDQASRRLTAHFGIGYNFATRQLRGEGRPIPPVLRPFTARSEALAGIEAGDIKEALVTRYPRGAPIGWHADAGPFGLVMGISLLSPVVMQFRNMESGERQVYERIMNPCSAYVMAGESRYPWQYHIPPTKLERFSITFRTLAENDFR